MLLNCASNHTVSSCQAHVCATCCMMPVVADAVCSATSQNPGFQHLHSSFCAGGHVHLLLGMLQEFHNLVNPKTKLISLVHVSNALGTILSTEEVIEAAQKVLVCCNLVHLDVGLAVHATPTTCIVSIHKFAPGHELACPPSSNDRCFCQAIAQHRQSCKAHVPC